MLNIGQTTCDLKAIWDKLGTNGEMEQGIATNLIPEGIIKNNKRMRFETRTIVLDED